MKPVSQPPINHTTDKNLSAPAPYWQYVPRRGLSIPSVTILDSAGEVIEDEQRRVLRHLAQNGQGADIIFGVGTTGEWNRLANRERQRLISIHSDEIERINQAIRNRGERPVEAWAGVTAPTRAETLANLECALDAHADAAVIAPLSISDVSDIIKFFQSEVSDLFDRVGRFLPVFLYDNAAIAFDPRAPHLHTRVVKRLSRLPFIFGVKVSAPPRVLGNYTKGAGHFKDKGEFGIYIGNAMLMFQVFRMEEGLKGRVREYWNRYLLHNELPVGVVSGPANCLPREWQRAWRACFAADERVMAIYQSAFAAFDLACRFDDHHKPENKMIACLKHALKIDGVIDSDRVAAGTPELTETEKKRFASQYERIKAGLRRDTAAGWLTRD
jgi:dihydrodipicolinate synthase/N-acetylneuraminate lyase